MTVFFILLVIAVIVIALVSFLSCRHYVLSHKEEGIDEKFIRGFRLRAMAGIAGESLCVLLAILLRLLVR